MSLAALGIDLERVYDLPLDLFQLYCEGAVRLEARRRLGYISDTSTSVGALFSSGDKMKEYTKALEKQSLGEVDGRHKTNRSD